MHVTQGVDGLCMLSFALEGAHVVFSTTFSCVEHYNQLCSL